MNSIQRIGYTAAIPALVGFIGMEGQKNAVTQGTHLMEVAVPDVAENTDVPVQKLIELQQHHKQFALNCLAHPKNDQGNELKKIRNDAGKIVPEAELSWVCIGGQVNGIPDMSTRIGDARLSLMDSLFYRDSSSNPHAKSPEASRYDAAVGWQIRE